MKFAEANKQLSLFEQELASLPGYSEERAITAICDRITNELGVTPPVSAEMIASMRGIVTIERTDQPFAGMLAPGEKGFAVTLRGSDSPSRQRFTICHEAAHTFFPGFSEAVQFRCESAVDHLERMCDFASAELLMPRRFFTTDLGSTDFDFASFDALSEQYQTSLESTIRRGVDLWDGEPVAALFLSVRNKPQELKSGGSFPPKLRLDYAYWNGSWPFFLRHKSADKDGLAQALRFGALETIASIDEFCAEGVGRVRVSARRLNSEGRVVALVRRAHP